MTQIRLGTLEQTRAGTADALAADENGPDPPACTVTELRRAPASHQQGDLTMTDPLPAAPCAMGIDVGGTKIAAGVVTAEGTICDSAVVLTPDRQDRLVRCLLQIVDDFRALYPSVAAIGVGAAGMIDYPSGRIRWAPNNVYRDLPLQQLLAEHSGLPAVVENDANAAAWAEATIGAGAGHGDLIVLTVGTGIGGGIIVNGELQRGHTGIGGEVGHIAVCARGGEVCGCGATGCLEAMAAGPALGRAGRRIAAADPTGHLAMLAGGAEKVTGEIVHKAALDGDRSARELFDEIGYWLGVGIASLVNIFDPELVVLAGGLAATGDLLLSPAQASFARFVMGAAHRQLPTVARAQMTETAGLIGAALLGLKQASGQLPRSCPSQQHYVPQSESAPAVLIS